MGCVLSSDDLPFVAQAASMAFGVEMFEQGDGPFATQFEMIFEVSDGELIPASVFEALTHVLDGSGGKDQARMQLNQLPLLYQVADDAFQNLALGADDLLRRWWR